MSVIVAKHFDVRSRKTVVYQGLDFCRIHVLLANRSRKARSVARSGLDDIHESRFCGHWPGCAARTASNAGGHSQGGQQSSWASGAKPHPKATAALNLQILLVLSGEAPLRAVCFVTRRLSGTTTRRSSCRAARRADCGGRDRNALSIMLPAKAASRPGISSRSLRNIGTTHCVLLASRVGLPGREPPLTKTVTDRT